MTLEWFHWNFLNQYWEGHQEIAENIDEYKNRITFLVQTRKKVNDNKNFFKEFL